MDESAAGVLGRKLLTSAPQILLQPSLLTKTQTWRDLQAGKDPYAAPQAPQYLLDATTCLWELVGRCLAGDGVGLGDVRSVLQALFGPSPSPVQEAAAWHALLSDPQARREPYTTLWHEISGISADPLPLFTGLLQKYECLQSTILENADVLICQHLLGSILPELSAVRALVPGARFWEVLGKPYSANIAAVQALEENGFSVNRESCLLPLRGTGAGRYLLGSFAQRHREIVRASVRRFFDEMPQSVADSTAPILVIDDGGVLIDAIGRAAFDGVTSRPIICIEQTQRGLYAARNYVSSRRQLPVGGFVVINVAQSLSKLVLESELIAKSVIENAYAWVSSLAGDGFIDGTNKNFRIGIIGYGAVGESIAQELRFHPIVQKDDIEVSDIIVYDRNRNHTAAAKRQKYTIAWSAEEMLSKSDMVIAATGGTSLDNASASYLREGTVLASASSGDVEFQNISDWESRQFGLLSEAVAIPSFDNVHGMISCHKPDGGDVYVVNGGFPVNFNGSIDPIDPGRIQLTRALMLAGVLQARGFAGEYGEQRLAGSTGEFLLANELDSFLFDSYVTLNQAQSPAHAQNRSVSAFLRSTEFNGIN